MSLIIAAMTGAVLGGISIPDAMGILCDGFSGNANTALAYVLLGTFATAIASTGLADMASKKLSQIMGGKSASVLLLILAAVACLCVGAGAVGVTKLASDTFSEPDPRPHRFHPHPDPPHAGPVQ